jgi:thiamine-phosphate pyrophosphorylase
MNCRLYLISPPAIELDAFVVQLEEALSGGDVGSFQLRLKDASDEQIIAATQKLLPIVRHADAAFILNDRCDLAAKLGADGVHLGQEDLETMPISKARAIVGDEAVIGISAHASKHLAMEAGEQGADYVAFGAFYPTQSKPMEKLEKWGTPTPDIVEWWSTYTVLPCVAIGGMTPANCAPLVAAGADFIAAITAVWNHPKGPAQAVAEFNRAIAEATPKQRANA